jgi:hypothetical protein
MPKNDEQNLATKVVERIMNVDERTSSSDAR